MEKRTIACELLCSLAGLSVQRRPGGDDTLQEEEEREEEEEEIAAESKWTREQRESEMSGMGAPGGAGTYLDADGEVRIEEERLKDFMRTAETLQIRGLFGDDDEGNVSAIADTADNHEVSGHVNRLYCTERHKRRIAQSDMHVTEELIVPQFCPTKI